MGKLLCEKNLRDVWCRNESVRAEIGQILHTHTHAAKLVVEIVGPTCLCTSWEVICRSALHCYYHLFQQSVHCDLLYCTTTNISKREY